MVTREGVRGVVTREGGERSVVTREGARGV